MMIKYLTFSMSIAVISWVAGILINAVLCKTRFYETRLTRLNFIPNENVNHWLGLQPIKWFIMHSPFRYLNPKLSIPKKILASELADYRAEMTTAELNHLFAFAFMGVFVFIKIYNQLYLFAAVMLLVNILMNLYPSLIQQQNKRRIDRYLHVLKQRLAAVYAEA